MVCLIAFISQSSCGCHNYCDFLVIVLEQLLYQHLLALPLEDHLLQLLMHNSKMFVQVKIKMQMLLMELNDSGYRFSYPCLQA